MLRFDADSSWNRALNISQFEVLKDPLLRLMCSLDGSPHCTGPATEDISPIYTLLNTQ